MWRSGIHTKDLRFFPPASDSQGRSTIWSPFHSLNKSLRVTRQHCRTTCVCMGTIQKKQKLMTRQNSRTLKRPILLFCKQRCKTMIWTANVCELMANQGYWAAFNLQKCRGPGRVSGAESDDAPGSSKSYTRTWSAHEIIASQSLCWCQLTAWKRSQLKVVWACTCSKPRIKQVKPHEKTPFKANHNTWRSQGGVPAKSPLFAEPEEVK